MLAGSSNANIEQTALFFDSFRPLRRRMVEFIQRMLDGQRTVGKPNEEHRVPLQTLGCVQTSQRHTIQRRRMLGLLTGVLLAEERLDIDLSVCVNDVLAQVK